MNSFRTTLRIAAAAGSAAALLTGCSHGITGQNAAPNVTPAGNRQAMIKWHREHDKKPATTPGP